MVNWIRRTVHSSFASIWLATLLLAIAFAIVVPNYFTGKWAWSQTPALSAAKALNVIKEQGVPLSGWQTVDQQTIELSHKKWSVQALILSLDSNEDETVDGLSQALVQSDVTLSSLTEKLQEDPIFIFLRPQSDAKDEPLVEWIDFDGLQQWTADQHKTVRLPLDAPLKVSTRYFRGWNQSHTYAVMQWYAWPTGGGAKISDWFWVDQDMQWRQHERMPWVAVTLLVPMKPLGDIAPIQPVVEAIAQSVQSTLVEQMTAATPPQGPDAG